MQKMKWFLLGFLPQLVLGEIQAATVEVARGEGVKLMKVVLSFEEFSEDVMKSVAKKSHDTFANAAIDFVDKSNHKAAFNAFENALKFDCETQDTNTRVRLSEYLIYGIRGFLNPSEETKDKAIEYLIEAAQLEFTRPDEPDLAGRMIRGFSEEAYEALAKEKNQRKALSLLKDIVSHVTPDPV